ncbi:MAG: ComF family protein [Ekhidna sp.]|nr:ComF family protein [Ekhidna sp.]
MIRDLISLIYPSVCINCNISLIQAERLICTKCKIDLPHTGDSFHSESEFLKKFSHNANVKAAASLLYFHQKGVTQKLLHKLKYEGKRSIGVFLGEEFADKLMDIPLDFIIPVPIHKAKKRKRGYNQSTEIAKGISSKRPIEIREDIVKRNFSTASQTRKSKVKRWHNMENVYSQANDIIEGKKVLVIDDVITTGATVGMLCDRLQEKEVSEIYVGSIARGH